MPKFHSEAFRAVVNLVQKVLAAARRLQPRPFIEAERVLHLLEGLGNVSTTERTEKSSALSGYQTRNLLNF